MDNTVNGVSGFSQQKRNRLAAKMAIAQGELLNALYPDLGERRFYKELRRGRVPLAQAQDWMLLAADPESLGLGEQFGLEKTLLVIKIPTDKRPAFLASYNIAIVTPNALADAIQQYLKHL